MSCFINCSRPTEMSEAPEILRLVYNSLLVLPEGQYFDGLLSWKRVLRAYSSGQCPLFGQVHFTNVIRAMDNFVEDWLNPEKEVKHLASVLQMIYSTLK